MKNFTFRESLARELKETPGNERYKKLAEAKVSSAYNEAEFDHRNFTALPEYNKNILHKIIESSESLEQLKENLADKPALAVKNNVRGFDYGRNLIKAINLALVLQDINLIPEVAELRAKISSLEPQILVAPRHDFSEKIERYGEYLRRYFFELNLTEREALVLAKKMAPEVFLSLDKSVESSTVLLNLIPETTTAYSCGGHFDIPNVNDDFRLQNFSGNSYIVFSTKNDKLIEALKIFSGNRDFLSSLTVEDQADGKQVMLRKIAQPSDDWIEKNHKKDNEEIFYSSREELGQYFKEDLGDFSFSDFCANPRDFVMEIKGLQRNMFKKNPKLALGGTADDGLNKKIHIMMPEFKRFLEYKDYYDGPDYRADINTFFNKVNEILEKFRDK
jgi:hypothetical protein